MQKLQKSKRGHIIKDLISIALEFDTGLSHPDGILNATEAKFGQICSVTRCHQLRL